MLQKDGQKALQNFEMATKGTFQCEDGTEEVYREYYMDMNGIEGDDVDDSSDTEDI